MSSNQRTTYLDASESQYEDSEINSLVFKIIVIGSQGVGKSSILNQYVKKKFEPQYNLTVGVEFLSKQVNLGDDYPPLQLQIWDTAGQESFKALIKSFYRQAAAVILTYSVTNKQSFLDLNNWLQEINNNSHDQIIIMVLANQIDQESLREVSLEEGQQWAKENGIHIFFEASAKEGTNIERAFQKLLKLVYNKFTCNDQYKSEIEKSVIIRPTHKSQKFQLNSTIIQSDHKSSINGKKSQNSNKESCC